MMSKLQEWFVRVFKPAPTPAPKDLREHDKTADDAETNAPKRRKTALRHPPERK